MSPKVVTVASPFRRSSVVDGGRDLEIVEVSKSYGGANAVHEVSFTLHQGRFLSLLGPSGSGKTTTLLMVAGFERPTRGDIRVGGRSVVDDPPQRRNLGVGFQSYALFPHMSVLENVEFPLKMRRVGRRERRGQAREVLKNVGLAGLENRRPRQLSGGQQQRVALARALVFEPDALLLDEPLGALDKRLRERLQIEIKELHSRMGVSVLYVTHDQEEAMMMSDLIAVMREGRIVQMGTPGDVYHHPDTPFVAHFLGETNLLPCSRRSAADKFIRVTYADGTRGLVRSREKGLGTDAGAVQVSVRPERIEFLESGEARENNVEAVILNRSFLGSHTRYTANAVGQEVIVKVPDARRSRTRIPGDAVRLGWFGDDCQLLPVSE